MPVKKKSKRVTKKKAKKKVVKKKATKRPKEATRAAVETDSPIKLQQTRFVQEYLIDFNATQAAVRAGYSPKGAAVQGFRMLRNAKIQKKLRELIKKQGIRTQVDADQVIQEAARIALADIRPAFNGDGTLKDIHDIPEDLRRAISGVEVIEEYTGTGKNRKLTGYLKKVKFWSKDKHVENLMKHLGLFREDNKQVGQTLAEAVHEALKNKTS